MRTSKLITRSGMHGITRRQPLEWLALIVALLVVTVFAAALHYASVAQLRASERERIQVFAGVLANDIEGNLTVINSVLANLIQDSRSDADATAPGRGMTNHLQRLEAAMPGVRALVIVDASGKVIASSNPVLTDMDLSQRAYFQTVKASPDATRLFVSAPFESIKKDLIITLARMLPKSDGSFGGLVLATLDPGYFTGVFRHIVYAPDLRTVVIHGDGRMFLSYPATSDIDYSVPEQPAACSTGIARAA
ncbi:hypothetical protein QN362_14325 [Actimicrobium sp. CCC2.4]|uniref:PDC sensor domain-containing protein n=1 Tax=Actimicrobium sp. CCC2.4 TaxID=3048606 RepID=UPI002AC9BF69|nr:cache domain-containing protein [Actimicrobium sp. CCC2.4]MEB0136513.1 hypothetical protein [Actimicrobium sp. CCC2.4]WPX30874.1 hypothetical protein RHM62_11415 [Actimicrobium sp. CCC2.4]